MLGLHRSPDRRFRLGRAILLGSVTLLAACSPSKQSLEREEQEKAFRLSEAAFRGYVQQLREYTAALLLCNSLTPRDWNESRRLLKVLQPFHVFDDDRALIGRFFKGDDVARRELGKRGTALDAMNVFSRKDTKESKKEWDRARITLLALGEPGQVLLTRVLLGMLLNGQFRNVWGHVRYQLVETGRPALETTVAVARELAKNTPADKAVFRSDDLTQLLLVILAFTEGRPVIEEFASHAKPNIRRVTGAALGESFYPWGMPILIRLLSEDEEWMVRTSTAEALGRMTVASRQAGKALVARLYKERDRTVLGAVLLAIGNLNYADGIPDLMKVLEHPRLTTAEKAMRALYRITGLRITSKLKWQEWYREYYEDWKRKRGRR